MTSTSTHPATLSFEAHEPTGGPPSRVARIHGIGATCRGQWAEQSAHVLADWWTRADRSIAATRRTCPAGCRLAPGHVHMLLRDRTRSRAVDLEPLYWADWVRRPGAARCAWLVLQVGLLIGLVDLSSAALTFFKHADGWFDGIFGMTRTFVRMLTGFGRALTAPLVTLAACIAVLVNPRVRSTVGDALAWTLDAPSHERVMSELTALLRVGEEPLVLVGHSQGGSIAAMLEPRLRQTGRDVRLVTLGSGHGLLSAMRSVLPRWSLLKSLVSWATVLAFVSLLVVGLLEILLVGLRPLGILLTGGVRIAGYAWLTEILSTARLHELLLRGTNLAPLVKSQLLQPIQPIPSAAQPAQYVAIVLAALLLSIGLDPIRRLRAATLTAAAGVDIVATHDLVAATMLQLTPLERLRRVDQCGSVLFDHTTYLRNGWSVLPLIAEQIELASGLLPQAPPRLQTAHGQPTNAQRHHLAGVAMRAWTRPLSIAAIVACAVWFTAGRVAPTVWIPTTVLCCVAAWAAVTRSSVRWLTAWSDFTQSIPPSGPSVIDGDKRTRQWWPGILALAATPLLGGAAAAFTTPALLHSLNRQPTLTALTAAAFLVGVALCAASWRSLFGFQRESITAVVLLITALLWVLRGTVGSAEVAVLMLALAGWACRRAHRPSRSIPRHARVPG
jgi:hypothetical protein